jgi:hypothetical protein
MFFVAARMLARVMAFGSSPFALIASFTARANTSAAIHACKPKPSGLLLYFKNASSSALWP